MRKTCLAAILLCMSLGAWAQDKIRTVTGETVVRKVVKIDRVDRSKLLPEEAPKRKYLRLKGTRESGLDTKVPFSYATSVRFKDGCEMFFDKQGLLFDKTLNPGFVRVDSGTGMLLEGVYEMSIAETKRYFGEDFYMENIRPYRKLYNAGALTCFGGVLLTLPWGSDKLLRVIRDASRQVGGSHVPVLDAKVLNALAISGVICLAGGVTMVIIGHNGCKRAALSFSGTGLAVTF